MPKINQTGVAHLLLLIAAVGVIGFILVSSSAEFKSQIFGQLFPKPASQAGTFTGNTFSETFDGAPSSPQSFFGNSLNWDVTLVGNKPGDILYDEMEAQHGPDCAPPLVDPTLPFNATTNPLVTHHISQNSETAFICRNHLMTAINSIGYSAVYLTPPAMVDFSQGEAVVRFDMSTWRQSSRDWMDLFLMPYDLNLQVHTNGNSSVPSEAVQILMDTGGGGTHSTFFRSFVYRNFDGDGLPYIARIMEDFIPANPAVRLPFEMRISRNHVRFCSIGTDNGGDWCWVNSDINPPLTWDRAVLQLNHRSYNPGKDFNCNPPGCGPNTWHWDNVSVSPAIPFTIIHANQQAVGGNGAEVTFAGSSPSNAHLRLIALTDNYTAGRQLQFSINGGASWQDAQLQRQVTYGNEHYHAYWTPVPSGVQRVLFRRADGSNDFRVRDVSFWSSNVSGAPAPVVTPPPLLPTPTPAPVATLPPAPTPVPTVAPTPAPANGSTLGYTSVAPNADTGMSNNITASRFTMGGVSGATTSMSVFVNAVGTSPTNQYQVAIYSDSNGQPGTLLARSNSATLVANSWNSVPISVNLSANTAYWLAYNSNGSDDVNNLRRANGGQFCGAPQVFGSWPNSFTPAECRSAQFNIFATFTPGATVPPPTPQPTPTPVRHGLSAAYFDNRDLTNLVMTRTDAQINFDWGQGSPSSNISPDTFSIRWTGQIVAPTTNTYTFTIYSDDGARLWINNQLIIDRWFDHGARAYTGSINLTAGQANNIRMEYYENSGRANVELLWATPNTTRTLIPESSLIPD